MCAHKQMDISQKIYDSENTRRESKMGSLLFLRIRSFK